MKDIDKELDTQIKDILNFLDEKSHQSLGYNATVQAIKQLINQANTPTHIMGKPIDEVCAILSGLEMERLAEMQLTMANLKEWQKLLAEEQKKTFEKTISRQLKELKGNK